MKRFAMCAFAFMAASACAAVVTSNVTLPTSRGTQQFLYLKPDAPTANLVFMIGGAGLTSTGSFVYSQLSRNRERFAERGYAVAILDAPSDYQPAGMPEEFRLTATHAADVAAVMAYMRERANVPTWVMGNSNGTISVANVALNLPASPPFGAVLVSARTVAPGSLLDMSLESLRRPTLVLHHRDDACVVTPSGGSRAIFERLSAAPAKRHIEFTGGDSSDTGLCGGGTHVMLGLDDAFMAAVTEWIEANRALLAPAALNVQGLWYKSPAESEAGWGVNIAHQGDILFITWFTYDLDGSQMWLVGSRLEKGSGDSYSGTLYRATGPPFNAAPFTPITAANLTSVGTANLSFTNSSSGTFQYTVNGVSQSKAITRQVFGPMPTCATGGTPGTPLNFQDLWYAAPAESEAGWGLNVTHQGDIVFMTWFTYDLNGRGMWIVGSRMERVGTANTFTGALYRTTGPAFNAVPFTPITAANLTQVGTGTLAFSGAGTGTFSYTVTGVSQTKNLVKQSFGPATVCR